MLAWVLGERIPHSLLGNLKMCGAAVDPVENLDKPKDGLPHDPALLLQWGSKELSIPLHRFLLLSIAVHSQEGGNANSLLSFSW